MTSARTLAAAIVAVLLAWPESGHAQTDTGIAVKDADLLTTGTIPGSSQTGATSGEQTGKPEAPEKNKEEKTAAGSEDKPEAAKDAPAAAEKPESLRVASWGGAYGESQQRAYFAPFQDETGIAIDVVSHNGKFDGLSLTETSGSVKWDIVDIGPAALDAACRDGTLVKVKASALTAAKDGTPAKEDFFPGTLHDCGVPSVAWSSAIVYDKRAFKKAVPKTAADFFDVKKFPGVRALPREPKYVLELALLADGVAPEDVYKILSEPDGPRRAFGKLDPLRDSIVWWDRAHEPLKLLSQEEAVMALAFNGRIFNAIVAEGKPFGIVWDGQIFELDFWAIPKASPNKDSALAFIAFATRPDRLARQASWFPYGPVRKSALDQVGKHPEIDIDMTAYIPTAKDNFKRALRLDNAWWDKHGEAMTEELKVWEIGDGGSARTGEDFEKETPPE